MLRPCPWASPLSIEHSLQKGCFRASSGSRRHPTAFGGRAHCLGSLQLTSLAGGLHGFLVEMDVDFADGTVDGELTSRFGETTAIVDALDSSITGAVDQGRLSARIVYRDGTDYLAGLGDPMFSFDGEMVAATYGPEGYFIGGAVHGHVSGTDQPASEAIGNFWSTSTP